MTCPYGGACPVETPTVRQTLPLTRPTSLSAPTFVLGALALWLLASIAWRPLLLPDEGRYVGVAWEMLRSGDWLTPTLSKPPRVQTQVKADRDCASVAAADGR